MRVSEQHRQSKDPYGVAKWQTIAKQIGKLRKQQNAVRRSRTVTT